MKSKAQSPRDARIDSQRVRKKMEGGVPRTVKKSLTRDDWLHAALEVLNDRGIDAVKVLSLSMELGVTRGSFYWHFLNREDLLGKMLDYRDVELTDAAIKRAKKLPGGPEKRLADLVANVLYGSLDRYDTAIRAWGLFDERAYRRRRKVERKRLAYLAAELRETGMEKETAKFRARMLFGFLLAGPLGAGQQTKAEKAENIENCMKFILI